MTRKPLFLLGHIFLVAAAITYTQAYTIRNLDVEVKSLARCIHEAQNKTQVFVADDSLQQFDYHKRRNLAHEVQQYVLPLWQGCNDKAQFLLQKHENLTLVSTQRVQLEAYSQLLNHSLHLWQEYVELFQESLEDILQRAMRDKMRVFMHDLAIHQVVYHNAMQQVINSTVTSRFTQWLGTLWT